MVVRRINESAVLDIMTAKNYKWVASDGHIIDIDMVCSTIAALKDDISAYWPKIGAVLKTKPILITNEVARAATDGYSIFFSPEWAEKMMYDPECGPLYLEFAAVHEVFHVLYRHTFQEASGSREYSDHHRANIAQDYQINYIIGNCLRADNGTDTPFLEPAACGRFRYDKKFAGMGWREIYEHVPATKDKKANVDIDPQVFIDEYNRLYGEKVAAGELK